jgi:hypothetical protein
MSNQEIVRELSALKDRALKASAENDREFYDDYLDADAIAILPQGRFDKSQVLASMTGDKAPFSAKRVEDIVIRPIGTDAAIVTYNAIYDRDGGEITVAATTIYHRGPGGWKGILYQQTPLTQ